MFRNLRRSVCAIGHLRDTSRFLLMTRKTLSVLQLSSTPLNYLCEGWGRKVTASAPALNQGKVSVSPMATAGLNSCLGQSSLTGPLGKNISKQWSVFQKNGKNLALLNRNSNYTSSMSKLMVLLQSSAGLDVDELFIFVKGYRETHGCLAGVTKAVLRAHFKIKYLT